MYGAVAIKLQMSRACGCMYVQINDMMPNGVADDNHWSMRKHEILLRLTCSSARHTCAVLQEPSSKLLSSHDVKAQNV